METHYTDNEFLNIAINEAIERIHKGFKLSEGEIYLSFSGGKDSTVVAELIKMANLPTKIPFAFADTRIELDATVKFVKEFDYPNIHILKPRKPFGQILKEYGKPAVSKNKSELLRTYQRNIGDPLSTARTRQLISGEAELAGKKLGMRTKVALAKKHFHLLHPDLEYKVANKCCEYMKKKPFVDFTKEMGLKGTFTGVRVAEGGARAMAYKSCTVFKKSTNTFMIMPIFDWSDDLVEEFISEFKVKLSDAYEVYGSQRTGCIGCPFSRDLQDDLTRLHKYEPKKYKATIHWLKDVYVDQGVKLEFDNDYMEYYEERTAVNDVRRLEMLEKFKDVRK